MRTKVVTASAKGVSEIAARKLVDAARLELGGLSPALVLVFASTQQPLPEVMPIVAEAFPAAVVLGSSTAGEFTGSGDSVGSTVLIAIAGDFRAFSGIGEGLRETMDAAVRDAIGGLPHEVPGYPHCTGILLLDPLAGNGEEATLTAATYLGEHTRLVGGAAGDDSLMKETFVARGARAVSNAVVAAVIFSKVPLGVGVCHGHRPLSSPMRITRAEGAVVYEIDGRPALSVWKDATRESARQRDIDVDAVVEGNLFNDYLNLYEAGIDVGANEYKIRVPLSRGPGDSLAFACGMPEGTFIRVMESVAEAQIESAREAARRSQKQLASPAAGAIVFDCSCRKAILRDAFSQAVNAIHDELGGAPLAGFETYGEIALDAGDMSGFHNTTTVVLTFPS